MRLFTAINFDASTKGKFKNIQGDLKKYSIKGNFTREDNLHLTLVFLGEVLSNCVPSITQVMDKIDIPAFSLSFDRLGSFNRNGGCIWWIGVEKNKILSELYLQLHDNLTCNGFSLENREYKPHLTLAREVVLLDNFDRKSIKMTTVNAAVDKVSLMKSERINGTLTYTEIYAKEVNRNVL